MQQKHLYIIVGTLFAVILAFVTIGWYFSKQQTNLSTQNIVTNIDRETTLDNEVSDNQAKESVKFYVKRKTFFHSNPNAKDRRKAFILEGDKGIFTSFNGDFGYALYTNHNGTTTEGWISLKDVEMFKQEMSDNLISASENNANTQTQSDNQTNIEEETSSVVDMIVGVNDNIQNDDKIVPSEKPYTTVEQMPSFVGGESEMQRFISQNLKYPIVAQEAGIQGRVTVRFVVSRTGDIEDIEIMRNLDPSCDREAIRVIKSMPRWVAGKQNGKEVSVYFTLPIVFRIK